ncbi:hypothetical protein M408DRAFT_65975 [Serendipita vermifera MAFF 305830]|uniref:Protein kinase domain-containing protein n=1 Tax=Serendipita vermifera MAFF 305830 TaxID=933852 RepID=A0A0C2WX29_SERVB|nr:hypothetical protein M408DRAFT_65975 [Serendipita vermifera MAFF 305830]
MIQQASSSKYRAPVPAAWQPFIVDNDYSFLATRQSSNADGCITARHTSGEVCLVKKFNVGRDFTKAKICLRELKMLRHLRGHKAILCAYDMDFELKNEGLEDVYLYSELPRSNLATLLSSRKVISRGHAQFMLYQILCALNFMHSAGIIHGNIRPESILVNQDTSVRLCDFSCARTVGSLSVTGGPRRSPDALLYEAPEIMLGAAKTSFAIDIWGVGCILAEILNGTPIFDRKDLPGQIRMLIDRLGAPPESLLPKIASPQVAANLRDRGARVAPSLKQFFPTADPSEMDVLQTSLSWDPTSRNKPIILLNKAYFAAWRSGEDEAVCQTLFTSKFEQESGQEAVNHMIIREVTEFRKIVRQETANQGLGWVAFSLLTARIQCGTE